MLTSTSLPPFPSFPSFPSFSLLRLPSLFSLLLHSLCVCVCGWVGCFKPNRKGPYVYEFEKSRPFDISAMQSLVPRDVLGENGWGAEAIAFSANGGRLWQMPEENRHSGCQKVLTMDCAQPALPPPRQEPIRHVIRQVADSKNDSATSPSAQTPSSADEEREEREEGEEREAAPDAIAPAETGDEVGKVGEEGAEKSCDIIANGWGTEKNASIPLCDSADRIPPPPPPSPLSPNATSPATSSAPPQHSCEDQAAWGKCEEAWMVEGGFCAGACGRCTHTTCTCPSCVALAPGNEGERMICNAQAVTPSNASGESLPFLPFLPFPFLHS